MKRYWAYFKYVVRHKWYVLKACWKHGLIWRGLVHDLSKFRPSEFVPYAMHFYNMCGEIKPWRDSTGYYKPTETGDPEFDVAWMKHFRRNEHHWQAWLVPEDGTRINPSDHETVRAIVHAMPVAVAKEMVCDWVGAGMAQGKPDTVAWRIQNRGKLILHPDTRKLVENLVLVVWNVKQVVERP